MSQLTLARWTWLARVTAIVVIGFTTFLNGPPTGGDLIAASIAYGFGFVAATWWLVQDLRNNFQAETPVAWALMAVSGGALTTAPKSVGLVTFALISVLAAGTASNAMVGWMVLGIDVLALEIGAVIWNSSAGSSVGFALLLVVAFIAGRNRRSYLVQAETSAALLTQSEELRAEQRRVAVLDERNRIAREIHDVLAHSLGALGIQIQSVRAVLEADPDAASELLDQAQRMASDGLIETRRAVQALRGDTTRLDEQIAVLATAHRERHTAEVVVSVDGSPSELPLSAEATVALVRVAQEALVNAAKHAPQRPVTIQLEYGDDSVRLVIANPVSDSAALTSYETVGGGYGLTGMRERLLLIHGDLTVGTDGSNWTVEAVAPR